MKYCFLVPAYKARFFDEALCSILQQTYRDFEVLVSDDCSPEDLKQIVDKYNDSRVKYRRNEVNIGAENLVNHWNLLLNLTDAEYIIMASDDDVFNAKYLESIDNLVNLFPEVKVFRPRICHIDDSGNVISEEQLSSQFMSLQTFLRSWSSMELYTGVPYYVFERKSLLEQGGFEFFPYAWFSDDATVIKQVSIRGIAVTKDILFSLRRSYYSISSYKDIHSLKGKVVAAQQFFSFLNSFKKYLPLELFESMKRYIQYTSKSEFCLAGKPFGLIPYLWLNSGYAPLIWKLSLLKIWICKS